MNQDGEIKSQEFFTGKDIALKAISFFFFELLPNSLPSYLEWLSLKIGLNFPTFKFLKISKKC